MKVKRRTLLDHGMSYLNKSVNLNDLGKFYKSTRFHHLSINTFDITLILFFLEMFLEPSRKITNVGKLLFMEVQS